MGQKSIQNVETKIRFPAILQKFDFADGQKKDQTDKGSKVETVTKHFKETLALVLGDRKHQSIDKNMCKFKAKSGLKHYIKYRLIKWGFKCWYRCEINTGYFYQLHLYRNPKPQLNLILTKVFCRILARICEVTTATCSSTTISTAQQLFKSYMSRDYMDPIVSNLVKNIYPK